MSNKTNKRTDAWAVVTGASSGIGWCYSKQLAQRGWNVVLVSNQANALTECAEVVARDFGVKTLTLCLDLSRPESACCVLDSCSLIDVQVLINNAGVFTFCPFTTVADHQIELYVGLHVETVAKLCRGFALRMQEQGGGCILNMSSLAAETNMPGIALYQATKAFIRIFSRSLWYEMAHRGVGVTVVSPGGVNTKLYGLDDRLLRLGVCMGILMPAEKLVNKALNRMFKHKKQYTPGWFNTLLLSVIRCLPDRIIFFIQRKLSRYEKG